MSAIPISGGISSEKMGPRRILKETQRLFAARAREATAPYVAPLKLSPRCSGLGGVLEFFIAGVGGTILTWLGVRRVGAGGGGGFEASVISTCSIMAAIMASDQNLCRRREDATAIGTPP